MRPRRESQLALGWRGPSTDLPAEILEACRKLIAQLLREVVEAERDEGDDGE